MADLHVNDEVLKFLTAAGLDSPFGEVPTQKPQRRRTSSRQQLPAFVQWVSGSYPLRFRRLAKDIEWLRKQAQKYGMDPEEVRWLL